MCGPCVQQHRWCIGWKCLALAAPRMSTKRPQMGRGCKEGRGISRWRARQREVERRWEFERRCQRDGKCLAPTRTECGRSTSKPVLSYVDGRVSSECSAEMRAEGRFHIFCLSAARNFFIRKSLTPRLVSGYALRNTTDVTTRRLAPGIASADNGATLRHASDITSATSAGARHQHAGHAGAILSLTHSLTHSLSR